MDEQGRVDGVDHAKMAWVQDVANFTPVTEQDFQYETCLQWCEVLREAVFIEHNGSPRNKLGTKEVLFPKMTKARMAAVHPDAPDAGYGSEENEQDLGASKKQSTYRRRFMDWLKVEDRWGWTKISWLVNHVKKKISESPNNCALIACHSLALLDIVYVGLSQFGIESLRIYGTVSNTKR